MKKSLPLACTAGLISLLCTSCFEHDVTLTINKDGSGTINEVTQLSADASANLAQMPGGQGPFAALTDKAKASKRAAQFGEGVTLQDIKSVDTSGQITSTVTFHFNDINKLKYNFGSSIQAIAEGMKPPGGPMTSEQPTTTYSYQGGTLSIKTPETAAKDKAAADPAAQAMLDQMGDAQLEAMKGMYKGVRMVFKVQVPDGIATTNATYHDDKSITLSDIELEKLFGNKDNAKKLISSSGDVDAIEEIAKSIPEIKVESKKEIEVKIK